MDHRAGGWRRRTLWARYVQIDLTPTSTHWLALRFGTLEFVRYPAWGATNVKTRRGLSTIILWISSSVTPS